MGLWGNPQPATASTQEIIKFSEIHDGVVITKTGELRMILMVSSINFALKSEQEQTAIVYAYQNFLNSMEFPIQIVMQSKKLDLFNYLAKLNKTAGTQTNELLRVQTLDYIDFVERLVNIANIMDKKFYVAIPFMPPPKIGPSTPSLLKKSKDKNATNIQISADDFAKYKQELEQRVQVVESGLGSVGVRSARLDTQQIIELFYSIYNPEEAAKEKLTKIDQLTSQIVESELEKPAEQKEENNAK